jgi:hypothetical protein
MRSSQRRIMTSTTYVHEATDHVSKHDYTPKTSRRIKGFLSKLMFFPRKEKVVLGLNNPKKSRWFPRWDPANRWPQGWCWWFKFYAFKRRINWQWRIAGHGGKSGFVWLYFLDVLFYFIVEKKLWYEIKVKVILSVHYKKFHHFWRLFWDKK